MFNGPSGWNSWCFKGIRSIKILVINVHSTKQRNKLKATVPSCCPQGLILAEQVRDGAGKGKKLQDKLFCAKGSLFQLKLPRSGKGDFRITQVSLQLFRNGVVRKDSVDCRWIGVLFVGNSFLEPALPRRKQMDHMAYITLQFD